MQSFRARSFSSDVSSRQRVPLPPKASIYYPQSKINDLNTLSSIQDNISSKNGHKNNPKIRSKSIKSTEMTPSSGIFSGLGEIKSQNKRLVI